MRTSVKYSSVVLLLAFASLARAQTPNTTINLGYRGSSSTGDEARWERFRDLRSGPVVGANYNAESGTSGFRMTANNVGYHDQQYAIEYNNFGTLKFSGSWNSIPLNYAFYSSTPWVNQGNNVWTLDPATRTAIQNGTAFGIGGNAADYSKTSVYRGLASNFPLQSRRDILNLGLKYRVSDQLGLTLGFGSAKRGGFMPFGGSFSFSNANEHPVQLDDRTNNINAGLEWVKAGSGMLRLEWNNSHFKNQFKALVWDNPMRATDYSNGKAPPLGPYDPSGYSNFNGPAVGRLALAPSNSMNSVSLVGLRKLPSHSTINGQVSFTSMEQNDALLPWTTNANIANSVVYAAFPNLKSLPRPTAQAEIRGLNAMLNFTTRPLDNFAFNVRYRFNDRENRTPVFDATEYVRFDAVPEETGGETEHFNIRQNTFESSGTFTGVKNTALKLAYIMDGVKREGRAFGNLTDHTLRFSADNYGNQYVTVRGVYENTHRIGSGFDQEAIVDGGAQPGLRFYDDAPLARNKGTFIVQLNPTEELGLDLSLASQKDKYNGAGQQFGLLDNSSTSYNISLNYSPTKTLTLGGNFGYDKNSALQKSRNANPPATTGYDSWTDANRDWSLENGENVKNFGAYLNLLRALRNTDLRLSYDRSKSDNAFTYSGARIQELTTNVPLTVGDGLPCGAGSTAGCFSQLPAVTNDWQQLRVNLTHNFNTKYGATAGYSYEKFDIVDYATRDLPGGTPRIDPLGAITTGYGNRPYTGNVFTIGFKYMFQAAPIF